MITNNPQSLINLSQHPSLLLSNPEINSPPALAHPGSEVYYEPGPGQTGLEIPDQNTQAKSACISANVPSRFTSIFCLFGSNLQPSHDLCGTIISRVVCKADLNHKPYCKHERCNDPLCPTCYTKFTNRLAERAIKRIVGYWDPYPAARLDHVILWPKFGTVYKTLSEAHHAVQRVKGKLGVVGAKVIFHPFRIKKEIKEKLRHYRIQNEIVGVGFWQLARDDVLGLGAFDKYYHDGPHFHLISQGYLLHNETFNEKTGWGYKKVRVLANEEAVAQVVHYLVSHTPYEAGSQTIRGIGKMSNNQLLRAPGEITIEDSVCSVCGAPLVEYDIDGTLKHDHVTRKVQIDKYFIKSSKSKNHAQALKKFGPFQDDLTSFAMPWCS